MCDPPANDRRHAVVLSTKIETKVEPHALPGLRPRGVVSRSSCLVAYSPNTQGNHD